jgi:hypothetical protein
MRASCRLGLWPDRVGSETQPTSVAAVGRVRKMFGPITGPEVPFGKHPAAYPRAVTRQKPHRNGVGSRFRPKIHHVETGLPDNDSRPLPPNLASSARCVKHTGLTKPDPHHPPVSLKVVFPASLESVFGGFRPDGREESVSAQLQ